MPGSRRSALHDHSTGWDHPTMDHEFAHYYSALFEQMGMRATPPVDEAQQDYQAVHDRREWHRALVYAMDF